MTELYSPETIAAALGISESYVRQQLHEYIGVNTVECMACGGRAPISDWGARHNCPQGLSNRIDGVNQDLRRMAARIDALDSNECTLAEREG